MKTYEADYIEAGSKIIQFRGTRELYCHLNNFNPPPPFLIKGSQA